MAHGPSPQAASARCYVKDGVLRGVPREGGTRVFPFVLPDSGIRRRRRGGLRRWFPGWRGTGFEAAGLQRVSPAFSGGPRNGHVTLRAILAEGAAGVVSLRLMRWLRLMGWLRWLGWLR